MSFEEFKYREKDHMHAQPLQFIANLPFGDGAIGAEGFRLEDQEQEDAFTLALNNAIQPINHSMTANCVDGRSILMFADGNADPDFLDAYVTHQLAGGLVLSTTKAAVSSGLVIIRDARSFQSAYETMHDYLPN